MSATEPRLTWVPMVPDMYAAFLGAYAFDISRSPDPGAGYVLQVWQMRPEDWPLVVWGMDGFSLEAAKGRAERLADERIPVIIEGQP